MRQGFLGTSLLGTILFYTLSVIFQGNQPLHQWDQNTVNTRFVFERFDKTRIHVITGMETRYTKHAEIIIFILTRFLDMPIKAAININSLFIA